MRLARAATFNNREDARDITTWGERVPMDDVLATEAYFVSTDNVPNVAGAGDQGQNQEREWSPP